MGAEHLRLFGAASFGGRRPVFGERITLLARLVIPLNVVAPLAPASCVLTVRP